jgi:hypothetical protein
MTTPDYDTDVYAWTQQQAQALRAKDWAALGSMGMRPMASEHLSCRQGRPRYVVEIQKGAA